MAVAFRTVKFVPKPANPQADARFQKVKNNVGQKAVQLKKHPPARKKAEEAAKAAKGPPNQLMAGAKEKQTDKMQGAKPEKVQPDSFKALLLAEIEKVMPEKLDDADKFMEGGKEQSMKGAVSGKVSEQKGNAEKDIKTTAKAPPDKAGIKPKEEENIPPDPKTPVPTVNAAEGMPVPRTNAEISQEQSKRDADQQMKDAQITTPQMKKANDPRFTAVLDAKKEVETVADASPAKYRAKEKTLLAQTNAKAQGDARRNLTAFVTIKTKSGSAVKSRQLAAKAKDEKARKEVADNIEAMYNETKMKVEEQLSTLESSVFALFDAGSAAAIAEMKSNSKREIEDYKDDRYSGISGKIQWFEDLFSDTPQGIIDIINKNMALFKVAMNTLVDRVANIVELRLKMAKDEIDRGQQRIKNYVSTLKGDLKNVGKAAEKEVAGRFDEMRASVDERKNALAQKLAESYKAAIDKGNAIASELEAENAGAAYRLAKKIAEIARLILDFKDKLLAILKKAVSVILDILSDPIGFFGNLVSALKQGFGQFKDNFAKNFKEAVAGWLFGSLGGVGFELPKDLSAGSIIKLVMGIAGLTYERLRAKAVRLIGERNVAILEKVYEYVKLLVTAGPDELWAKLKEDVGNLQDRVVGEIKSWLLMSLVEAGIKKLLMMAVPGAGFVQAAIAIYKLIVFIIERASQIADFISSVVDSVSDMVAGNIAAAANRIERALVQALSLIFDLLARLVGLSGIADKIKSIVKKVQDVVDKAIDKVLDKIVQGFKKLFGRGKGATGAGPAPADSVGKDVAFTGGGESHHTWIKVSGRSAEVMIASTPSTIKEFLDKNSLIKQVSKENPAVKTAVGEASKHAKKTKKTAEEFLKDANAARQKKTLQSQDDLAAALIKLLNLLVGTNAEVFSYIGKKVVKRGENGAADTQLVQKIENYSFLPVTVGYRKGKIDIRRNTQLDDKLKKKLPDVYLDDDGILRLGVNPNRLEDTRTNDEKFDSYKEIVKKIKEIKVKAPKIKGTPTEAQLSQYRKDIREAIVTEFDEIDTINELFERRILDSTWQGNVYEAWVSKYTGRKISRNQLIFVIRKKQIKADRYSGTALIEIKSQLESKNGKYSLSDHDKEQILNYKKIVGKNVFGYVAGNKSIKKGKFTEIFYYCNHEGLAKAFKDELDTAGLGSVAKVYVGSKLFKETK